MQAITKEESKKWKKKSRQTERVAKQDLKETMSLRQHPVEVTDSELKGITEAVEQDHKEPAKPQHHHVEITDSVITSNAEAASQQGMTNGRKEGAKALRFKARVPSDGEKTEADRQGRGTTNRHKRQHHSIGMGEERTSRGRGQRDHAGYHQNKTRVDRRRSGQQNNRSRNADTH